MSDPALRAELQALLQRRSFRYGDFLLSSGRRSDFYFDGKQVTLEGRGLWVASRLILDRCRELEVTAVGGLTLGADPIAAGVAALSGTDPMPLRAFIVRKQAKDHGTARAIEGPTLGPHDRVLLVDDVVTTGSGFLVALEQVRATGAEVVEALALVDREEGGEEALAAVGLRLHALFRRSEFPAPASA
ncbi:MAG TPA: orotate phosphoribosyltransferase [Candidatus Dormibacteraeota bacterium]|nr:orotate phosphoribosyltransferase [Candidatus Dormibacteraeota bacterium]